MISEFPAATAKPPLRKTKSQELHPVATGVTCKGFYFTAFLQELANHGHHLERKQSYRDFGDYPLQHARELLEEGAMRLYPHERRPEAYRRVGWIIYPTLVGTMVGRVIFGSLGNDVPAILRIAGRGFDVSLSQGRYEALRIGKREAEVRVRDFPFYPESFLVGVFEGMLAHYGFGDARINVHVLSSTDVDLSLSW